MRRSMLEAEGGLSRVTRSLFPLCRALGLLPYGAGFGPSVFWSAYSLGLSLLLVLGALLHQLVPIALDPSEAASTDRQILLVRLLADLTTLLLHTYKMYRSRSELALFFSTMVHLDDEAIRYRVKHIRFWSFACLLWGFLGHNLLRLESPSWNSVTRGVIEVLTVAVAMEYCSFLELITRQLSLLQEAIKNDKQSLMSQVDKHSDLVDLAASVDGLFSFQQIGIAIKIFVGFIAEMYFFIKTIISKDFHPLKLIGSALVSLQPITLTYRIAEAAEETQSEADNFNNKLFNLMRESKDLCSNDKLHLYVTMKQSVNFTACGFFNLGYPLVTSIIAAATTYLVILVQFSMT